MLGTANKSWLAFDSVSITQQEGENEAGHKCVG